MKPERLGAAFRHAAACGWTAAKTNFLPALVIQCLMFLLVLGNYLHWPTTIALKIVADWKEAGGAFFSFIATGIAGGVFSELFKVALLQKGRFLRANFTEGLFKFLVMGFGGLTAGLFYSLQDWLFGSELHWQTIALKVILDQFVFTAFFACPIPVIINYWRDRGLSLRTLGEAFTPVFYVDYVLPLLVANWCFWIPMVSLVYAMPASLQFPLFLCIVMIWGLLFTSILRRECQDAPDSA